MKIKIQIILISLLLVINNCIVPYKPETTENEELLIVEGLITDQHEINTIKLHMSVPLWKVSNEKPLKGCMVWISDDMGKVDSLKEVSIGTYVTNIATFQGKTGRKYILHINTPEAYRGHSYESLPMEMKPVPPIDSIYYEKKVYVTYPQPVDGCQIYLDTHDPSNSCKYYRWNYSETWEFHLPYYVTNRVCWLSNNSDGIFLKNTDVLGENKISRYPLYSITDPVDRLSVKYSILVNQYSLNEDEYHYWESLKNMSDQVGGLYGIIPSAISSNVFCLEKPEEKVLGYFSVSAMSTKRLFIKDNFRSIYNLYYDCISDTVAGTGVIPGLNSAVWIIIDNSNQVPPIRYLTNKIGCADCRARGTTTMPAFWNDGK
jgi:hypothetical protein